MNSISLAEHSYANTRPIHRMLSTVQEPHYSVSKGIQFNIWDIRIHAEQWK